MRAACLLAVLLAARAAVLVGREVPLSLWSPLAYVWQDVLVALLFLLVDSRLKGARVGWAIYGLLVAYIAVNVPITRVLSTPLTWTILRAARGPLSDAVLHYVTFANLLSLAVPLLVGVIGPRALIRRPVAVSRRGVVVALLFVAIGPFATMRVETGGLHRNAFGALAATSVARLSARGAVMDWRVSPFGPRSVPADLTSLRGSMHGRNVLLVVLESTGARHLGLYGSVPDPAPNLTALARQSIIFERAYSVYPRASRGCLPRCARAIPLLIPPQICTLTSRAYLWPLRWALVVTGRRSSTPGASCTSE